MLFVYHILFTLMSFSVNFCSDYSTKPCDDIIAHNIRYMCVWMLYMGGKEKERQRWIVYNNTEDGASFYI